MGKKITLEIQHWGHDNEYGEEGFHSPTVLTQEFRFTKSDEMPVEDFEKGIFQRAHQTLQGLHTEGFVGFNEEKAQFFTIAPGSIVSATSTISDTIDVE